MTNAQKIYATSKQIDFAIQFKTFPEELKEELRLIHSIQITAHKIHFYQKRPSTWFKNDGEEICREHLQNQINQYESKYGKYELKTTNS